MRRWLILAGVVLMLGATAAATFLPSAPRPREAALPSLGTRHYTRNPATPVNPQSIEIRYSLRFPTAERALILEAIQEWNHVLNGHIRLEPRAGPPDGPAGVAPGDSHDARPAWMIERLDHLPAPSGPAPIALTVTLPGLPVTILVIADRLGSARLDRVMLHEIGHGLGLPHDAYGHLMQELYRGNEQICIDKAAVAKLAALKGLPLSQLNWCTY